MKRFFFLLALVPAACTSPSANVPSLAPRTAEAIDPRLPIEDRSLAIPADQALQAQAHALLERAQSTGGRFAPAIALAERLAGSAGAAQSESWIAAQQALSAAIAERAPVTRALGDIDALTTAQVQAKGGLSPADIAGLSAVAREIAEIDRRQAARISAVQARLRG